MPTDRLSTACPICSWSPGESEYRFIYETTFWRVVLAPNQCLLGRCVVQLKRHCGSLGELAPAEVGEWMTLVGQLEGALRAAFHATMLNWSSYMNHAFRHKPADPHVHWWVVPRYSEPVQFAGLIFDDPDFGGPYQHARQREVPPAISSRIAKQVRKGLL